MLNQRGFAAPILIWVVIGLIAIVAVSKTGSEDKELPKIPNNNQIVDQQLTKATIQPNPTGDPQVLTDKVKQYYSNISARQFDQAWGLLSKNFQNYSQSYDHFVKGYETTKSILIQDTHVQDLSANTVFIKLQSTDNINNQVQTKNYSGTWRLIFEDGSWKLDTAEIALASIFPVSIPKQRAVNQPQIYYDDPTSDPSDETFYNSNNPGYSNQEDIEEKKSQADDLSSKIQDLNWEIGRLKRNADSYSHDDFSSKLKKLQNEAGDLSQEASDLSIDDATQSLDDVSYKLKGLRNEIDSDPSFFYRKREDEIDSKLKRSIWDTDYAKSYVDDYSFDSGDY